MSQKDLATVSISATQYLKTWSENGRSQCLEQLAGLCATPDNEEEIRTIVQVLLGSLLPAATIRLQPNELADFYCDLVQLQPSSSQPDSEPLAIHQMLLDAICVVDDILDDEAFTKEAEAAKEQTEGGGTRKPKEKEAYRHRQILDHQPLVQFVRRLMSAGVLSQDKVMSMLDYVFLQDLGLVRDSAAVQGKERRSRTQLIYKQTKVNLLREQSEGYSKFIIELFNSLGAPQDVTKGGEVESQTSLSHRTQQAQDRLMKIAGYFDLDPTRMLDLTLDVFSTHVMTHFDFCISLMRQFMSSRIRLLRETRLEETGAQMETEKPNSFVGMDLDDVISTAEGFVPTVPSSAEYKNPLAQIIGFKFAYYQSIEQSLPQALVFASALLIREGLLSINDLYTHLSPDESGMIELSQRHESEMRKRIRTVKTTAADKDNALANAPVLPSDDDRMASRRLPPQPVPVAPTKPIKEPRQLNETNQHRDLAIALLSVGALRPAMFILTKNPWLISRYPQIADIMLYHLEYSIEPVYSVRENKKAGNTIPARKVDGSGPTVRPTMTFPPPPATNAVQQVFFFPRWTERIPVCSRVDELPCVVSPFLRIIGAHAYRHLPVFVKLCRIAQNQCQAADVDEAVKKFWVDMIRINFFPLLSMSEDNALLGMEIWPILQKLDQASRWSLYAEWLQTTYDKSLELQLRKALATRESKGILRRLSAKNLGQSARALAKIAHHNPCVVFNISIDQVMSYDNLTEPVIEALRTLTPIGYDILTFSLLDAFSQEERPRMKDDGTNVAHWLQSLASFTAQLCRRYSQLDPTSIVQFVAHRLHTDSPMDAIILRELISKMSGIEPLQLLADKQIAAMAGGPVLQIETVASEARGALQTKSLQTPADKLLKALSDADLIFPMLALLAQQSQLCVYKANTGEAVLKGLGSMFDDLRGIFFQFITFVGLAPVAQTPESSKIRGDFFSNMPSLVELVRDYKFDPMMVLHMCRGPLQRSIVEQAAAAADSKASKAAVAAAASGSKGEATADAETKLRAQIMASKDASVEDMAMQVDAPENRGPWLPVLQPWIDAVAEVLPPRVNVVLGAPFFVTYWQLTLFEVVSLLPHYKEHLSRISKLADEHARLEGVANRGSHREKAAWFAKKERLDIFKEALVKESNDQVVVYAATKKRLALERMHWFDGDHNPERITYIIQYCLFPRALLTPMDADFAAHFIKLLHIQGTKGFWTVQCYDKLFGEQVGSIVFCCTQNEVRNYGRFLRGVLRDLAAWHKDETLFNSDSKKGDTFLPGFTSRSSVFPPAAGDMLTWTAFKKFVRKIHTKLCSALTACISNSSGEFMHVSNAILVLKEILPVFPLGTIHASTGQFLDKALQGLLDKEKRGDIKLLATSYQGQLRMVKKEWEVPSDLPTKASQASKPSAQVNGHSPTIEATSAKARTPTAPHGVPPTAPGASRAARPSTTLIAPTQHPLPANPSRPRASETPSEPRPVERPQVIKRINRDNPTSRDSGDSSPAPRSEATSSANNLPVPPLAIEITPPAAILSPRPLNGQPQLGSKDVPLGPRNQASRGHRLSEDPSSRPPPSASMLPPKAPSSTPVAQELRAQAAAAAADSRASSRAEESRKRSPSPSRATTETNQDSRHKEDDRSGERRSARDESRKGERRGQREDERDRDRERDRRRDPEKERERDGSRRDRERERDGTARASSSRNEDSGRGLDSPHRQDDAAGRKRTRDPREEDPSDRSSKRPTREREREREREKDRRDRNRDKDKDKEHRHRERRRDKEDTSSPTTSPKETEVRDKDAGKSSRSGAPLGPRAMMDDKQRPTNANTSANTNETMENTRKERERERDRAPSRTQSNGLLSNFATRTLEHSLPQLPRDRRTETPITPSEPRSSVSLAARIAGGSILPPRPALEYSRENSDRLDREAGRKRTASARSAEDANASSKRFRPNEG